MITNKNEEVVQERVHSNGRQSQPLPVISEGEDMLLETTPLLNNLEEQFTIRPATMEDVDAAVELFNVCANHMIGTDEVTLSDVRTEWLLPEFDLNTSTRLVTTPEGKLVGYVEVWDINESPVKIWVWGRVHPDYEGRGIGSLLMHWAEDRARQALARVPDDLRVVMESGSHSTYEPAHRLFGDLDMTEIRHFHTMAIDLDDQPPEAQWPDGIKIRTTTGEEELREVVWAVEDAFKDHWGYVEQPIEQEYKRWLHFIQHEDDYDPTLWFLAMDGDEIAGISLCYPKGREDPEMGWVGALGVRRPWRRMGLGLALLQHSFGEFYRRGKPRAGLGVDAGSLTGATRLYERAGMKPIRQFTTYEKELRPGRDIVKRSIE